MIDLSKKKILITGANGFLGKHLVENLLEKRKVPKENLFLPDFKDLDLRKWENCQKAVQDKDIVIHLAAKVGGIGLNREKPGELFYDNIIMGTQLIEAARQAGVEKFTNVGTICAYPKFTPVPFQEKDLWQGYPEETNAPYGLAKKILLVQAQAYRQQYGMNVIYLLPVNMYGQGDNFDPQSSHVIAALIKKIYEAQNQGKDYIEVWGTGKATREFLYVKDGAEAIISATEKYNKPEPVNLGSGMEISIKDLAELICKLMDFKGEIKWDYSKPDGQPRRRLDISKAENEFDFRAKTDFITGLKNTISWYIRNYQDITASNSKNNMNKLKSSDFEFNLKTKLKLGQGLALELGKYLKDLKFKRIGVIIDPGIYNTDYGKEILENLSKENFDKIKIWEYKLEAEPDYDSLDRLKFEFLDENLKPTVDCFVGIGGGSVIDFSKGLATLVNNLGESRKYKGFPDNINPPLPTIALPTTAGTGSEVTFNAVFTDLKDKKKLGINTMHNFPVLAVLDPNLILSCPKSIMVSSGMDALTHILESYVAERANSLTRTFSKEGFRLVFNNLSKISDNPKDIKALSSLQLGAYLAGIALMNSGSGPAGALSYSLGVHFKVAHGLAGAVFLPYIIEHNVKNGYDYSQLYDLIDGNDKTISKQEKSYMFSKKLFELAEKLEVPKTLRDFGVNPENVEILLKETENLQLAFDQNSIPFSVEQGKGLIKKLI